MNLKKFAAMTIMFTTATSLFIGSASTITTVPNTVLAAETTLEVSESDKTEDNGSSTDTNITDVDVVDTNIVESTDTETDNESADTSKDELKSARAVKSNKIRKKTRSKNNYSSADLRLMSSIINCEAGIEPYQGKIAVGIVVMNRIKSRSFPNTLKGVIYQSGQFSPVRNGSLSKRLSQYDAGRIRSSQWKRCISAAKKVLNGQRTIIYNGRTKNMSDYHFFSVGLRGARLSLGGHKFK